MGKNTRSFLEYHTIVFHLHCHIRCVFRDHKNLTFNCSKMLKQLVTMSSHVYIGLYDSAEYRQTANVMNQRNVSIFEFYCVKENCHLIRRVCKNLFDIYCLISLAKRTMKGEYLKVTDQVYIFCQINYTILVIE